MNTYSPPAPASADDGFGIASSLRSNSSVDVHVAVDPNVVRALDLAAAERQQYLVALYGTNWESENQAADEYSRSCVGSAYSVTPGIASQLSGLRNAYWTQRQSYVKANPAVQEAKDAWRQCLRDQGLEASTRADLLGLVDDATAVRAADGQLDSTEIDEIASLEQELAKLDVACRGTLLSVIDAAIVEFDRQFEQEHFSQLQPYRAELWQD